MNQQWSILRNALALGLLLSSSACVEPTVTRVYNGEPREGRAIEYEAYAAYARGLDAEHDGHNRVAARWFEEATRYDPASVEIWTRLGANYCVVAGRAKAHEAFAEAERFDPRYEPLFRERAICENQHQKFDEATKFAARAVELDPDRDEAIVLYANCLEGQQKVDEAERLLASHLLRHPQSVSVWDQRFKLAQRRQDALVMKQSAEALLRLAPRMANDITQHVPELGALAQVDDAIRHGNIDEARRAARHAHLPPGELAVRAVALGAPKLAREQAEHVLGADPTSTSARVALASASDVLADAPSVGTALSLPVGERLLPLSPLARLVYADLLARHADREAVRAFVGTLDTDKTNDPVYEALRSHLVARLGGTNTTHGGT